KAKSETTARVPYCEKAKLCVARAHNRACVGEIIACGNYCGSMLACALDVHPLLHRDGLVVGAGANPHEVGVAEGSIRYRVEGRCDGRELPTRLRHRHHILVRRGLEGEEGIRSRRDRLARSEGGVSPSSRLAHGYLHVAS